MADRYTYLPSIGLFLAIAWAVSDLALVRRPFRVARAAGALAVVAALAVAAHAQAALWKDSLTLFRHALAVTRNNYLAHLNVAVALSKQGRWADAEKQFRAVLRSDLTRSEGNKGLSEALRHQGKAEEAVRYARRAKYFGDPNDVELLITLAEAYAAAGRLPDARKTFEQALSLAESTRAPHGHAILKRLRELQ